MDEAADSKDTSHGQLHLHAPLLSTRRFAASPRLNAKRSDSAYGSDTCRRVPFLWERVPGTPKSTANGDDPPPQPKLPPGRLHQPPKEDVCIDNNNRVGAQDKDDDNDNTYLDAMDMMSFFESSGVQERGAGCMTGLDSNAVQSKGNLSPSFIMKRFLPAANALASSSSIAKKFSKKGSKKEPSKWLSTPARLTPGLAGEPFSPPKSCGLLLFPWGLKQALCGFKSPVRSCSFRKCYRPTTAVGIGSRMSDASRGDVGKCSEQVWRIQSPCESRLSNTVSSIHEKRG